jgi:beta-lactamase class A
VRFSLLLACFWPVFPLHAQTDVAGLWEQKLRTRLQTIDGRVNGVIGIAAIDLTSGHVFSYNADAVFPTASSIKIAILIRMFRDERAGKFKLSDSITLQPGEYAGGSGGPLQEAVHKGPFTTTIRDVVENMIVYSDNTATNKCIQLVGMDAVNRLLDSFGLHATRLRRKMMDNAAAARGDENVSTPLELARLLQLIYEGKAADGDSCAAMLDILKRVRASIRKVVPPEIAVAAKPGDVSGVHCEVGLVYLPGHPFIVNAMASFLDDKMNPVGEIAAAVFEYFSKLAHSNEYGRRLD